MTEGPRFQVVLRVVKDPLTTRPERPVAVRLRAFLKTALRAWGLKCESIAEVKPPTEADRKGVAP